MAKVHSLFDFSDTFIGLSDSQFEARLKNMTLKEKEDLFLKAKDRYYSGDPIMSDPQFDRLEQWLDSEGSKVVNKVGGADTDRAKLIHKHMSPMLSLEKIQVNDEDNFPLAEIQTWNSSGIYPLEATPKFDGNAVELQYDNGQLVKAVTRGEDGLGSDVTAKLKFLAPTTIPSTKRLEIRGEVVMPFENFKKDKYAGKKNERNMVAGILGRDDKFEDDIKDCQFIAYSIKMHEGNKFFHVEDAMNNLAKMGFNKECPVRIETINSASDYRRVYDIFKTYRATQSPFRLDGIVFKMPEKYRASVGDGRKAPKWAIAIKFPAKEVTTTIMDIKWEVGYTGELSPVGILEPVDLDGSEVKRASLYNKTRIEENCTFPGAIVSIRKAGDIIPQVTKIIQKSPRAAEFLKNKSFYPTHCPSCNCAISIEVYATKKNEAPTEHLMCNNMKCPARNVRRLSLGLSALKIKGIGESTCEGLFASGVENIFDVFNPDKMNTQALCKHGIFKPGRQLELILAAIKKFNKVDLKNAILALQFEGLGDSGSTEVSKLVANQPYSFDSFEKAVVEPFLSPTSWQTQAVKTFLQLLKDRGVEIVMPTAISGDVIVFEMTGSPEGAGYKTKDDLKAFLAQHGYTHGKLKDAQLLLTDSYTATTSKMKDAAKKGIKILTYEDLINTL